MKIVKQRGDYDCGVACIAAVLGCEYNDALALVGRDPNDTVAESEGQTHAGLIPEEIVYALWQRGRRVLVCPVYECAPAGTLMNVWRDVFRTPSLQDIGARIFEDGATAILGVESKNGPYAHWVVVSGGEVLDPSNKLTYENGETLPVQTALIIEEPSGISG